MLRQLVICRRHALSKSATTSSSITIHDIRRRTDYRTIIPNNHRLLLSLSSSSLADPMITYNDGVTSDNSFDDVRTKPTVANIKITRPSSSSSHDSSIPTEETTPHPINEATIITKGDNETNSNNKNTKIPTSTPPPLPKTSTTTTTLQEQMTQALSSSNDKNNNLNHPLHLFHQSQSQNRPLLADHYRTLLSSLLSSEKNQQHDYVTEMMAIVMDYHRYYNHFFTDEEYLAIINAIYPPDNNNNNPPRRSKLQSRRKTTTTQSFYQHMTQSLPLSKQSLYLSHWLLSLVRCCPEHWGDDMERAGSGIWHYVRESMGEEEWIVEGEVLSEILMYSYKRGRGVVYHEVLEELVQRGYSPKPYLILHLLENTILSYHLPSTPLSSIPSLLSSLLTLQNRHTTTTTTSPNNPYHIPPSLLHHTAQTTISSSPSIAIHSIHLLFDLCDSQNMRPTLELYELAITAFATQKYWMEVIAILKEMEADGGYTVGRGLVMSLGRRLAPSMRYINDVYDLIRYGDGRPRRGPQQPPAVPDPLPSLAIMNAIMAGCAARGDVDRVFETFRDCEEWGVGIDEVTVELLVKCLAECEVGEDDGGEEYEVALDLMEMYGGNKEGDDDDDDDDGRRRRRKKRMDGYLAEMLRKGGRLEEAADKIPGDDVVSLLQTHLRRGDYDKMEDFLEERKSRGNDDVVVLPDWFRMRWERVKTESRQRETERIVSSDEALPGKAGTVIGDSHDLL